MKKFWNWFISSNHYKHFICGWIIGFGITGWFHSIYAVALLLHVWNIKTKPMEIIGIGRIGGVLLLAVYSVSWWFIY